MKVDVEIATCVEMEVCQCGCGQVYIHLMNSDREPFAAFSLHENQWVPFAQDCVRLCRGEEPMGPDGANVRATEH